MLFRSEGLDCAACAAELEEELSKIKGISSVSVSFVMQKIALEYADEEALEEAIAAANNFEEVKVLADGRGNVYAKNGEKDSGAAGERIVLKIENLHCAGCAAELEEILKKHEGLSGVSVDFVGQKIAFTAKDKAAVKKAIETADKFEKVHVLNAQEALGEGRNAEDTKKNAKKDALENLVFNATIKYVLRPDIIDKAAKIITKRFNSDLKKSAVLQALEKDLAMCNKAIDGIMAAIEQGIVTKTTRERLTDLERQQSVFEEKLAVEQAKQVKPITEDNVRAFIKYFANKRYETQEAKNEFFNSFINRVILYDDRAVIIYNIDPDHEKTISAKDNLAIEEALHKEKPIYKATDEIAKYIDGEFINTAANENGEADFEAKNAANKGKSSPELSQFKRACRGAEKRI